MPLPQRYSLWVNQQTRSVWWDKRKLNRKFAKWLSRRQSHSACSIAQETHSSLCVTRFPIARSPVSIQRGYFLFQKKNPLSTPAPQEQQLLACRIQFSTTCVCALYSFAVVRFCSLRSLFSFRFLVCFRATVGLFLAQPPTPNCITSTTTVQSVDFCSFLQTLQLSFVDCCVFPCSSLNSVLPTRVHQHSFVPTHCNDSLTCASLWMSRWCVCSTRYWFKVWFAFHFTSSNTNLQTEVFLLTQQLQRRVVAATARCSRSRPAWVSLRQLSNTAQASRMATLCESSSRCCEDTALVRSNEVVDNTEAAAELFTEEERIDWVVAADCESVVALVDVAPASHNRQLFERHVCAERQSVATQLRSAAHLFKANALVVFFHQHRTQQAHTASALSHDGKRGLSFMMRLKLSCWRAELS